MSMTPMTTTTMMMAAKTIATSIKAFGLNHYKAPLGWAQIWAHESPKTANCSKIGTSQALSSLPWEERPPPWYHPGRRPVQGHDPADPIRLPAPRKGTEMISRSLRIVSLFIAAAGAAALARAAQPPAADLLKQADELFAKAGSDLAANEQVLALYDRTIAADPALVKAHVGKCRTLARLQRHAEAVPVCSEAVRLAPNDWEPLRFRGHYYISTRRFDEAVADLQKAASLQAPGKDDYNIYYHLGLAHYLSGHWEEAARAYERCAQAARDDDGRVACTTWLVPSLIRAGRKAEAEQLLGRVAPSMQVKENQAYLDRLLLFKGVKSEAQVAEAMQKDPLQASTVGYGIGLWHLLQGRTDRAREYFQKASATEARAAFGYIASETELKRMK